MLTKRDPLVWGVRACRMREAVVVCESDHRPPSAEIVRVQRSNVWSAETSGEMRMWFVLVEPFARIVRVEPPSE